MVLRGTHQSLVFSAGIRITFDRQVVSATADLAPTLHREPRRVVEIEVYRGISYSRCTQVTSISSVFNSVECTCASNPMRSDEHPRSKET